MREKTSGDQETPTERNRLDAIAAKLSAAGARSVDVEICFGSPTTQLLEKSHQQTHSLIVMGSQGAGFIKEVFLGSVSHNLVRLARQPVLLIPAARDGR